MPASAKGAAPRGEGDFLRRISPQG